MVPNHAAAPSPSPTPPPAPAPAIVARGLVKDFDGFRAVDRIDLTVPAGSIFGILGPNGAGKTTTLRMLLGIIAPDAGHCALLGNDRPLAVAREVGYLPEERGLYPTMTAVEAIAFMGALRGLALAEGRRRARALMERHGLGHALNRQIRQLSKGMAQTVQLLGTIVHRPRLIILDEPFSGLDALNQQKLEALIRAQAEAGTTIIFSTHVIAHAERLCEQVAIIAGGRMPFAGSVDAARRRLRPRVRLETRAADGPWRAALPPGTMPPGTMPTGRHWHFELPEEGVEPLLQALIAGDAGIVSLSIERPGLHDAFIAIAGEAAAADLLRERDEEAGHGAEGRP
ncbi:MAG: ATP-binding cassette domain-containing protein [Sphingobium sp.]